MKKILYIFALLPLLLSGQTIDIAGGNYLIDAPKVIIDSDTLEYTGAIAQYHAVDTIDVGTANSWINVKFDLGVANETTYGYSFGDDSTYFIVGFAGDTRVQGCGHWGWRGGDNETVKVYIRTTVNSAEARCLQSNETRSFKGGDSGILPFVGTINHSAGDTIRIQYQVDDILMDWFGDGVFDNPVAFSVNFEKINCD